MHTHARFGLDTRYLFPTTLVSDNGPQFTSSEFASKMSKWKIKHILTPPYHPASNGLAERGVGIVKDKLKKMGVSGSPLDLMWEESMV